MSETKPTTPKMLPCPFCGGNNLESKGAFHFFAPQTTCIDCQFSMWTSSWNTRPAKEPSVELEKAFSEAADFAIIVLQEVCYHFNGLEQQGVEWAKDNALWIRADGALKALNVPMRAYRAQVTKEGDEHVS